LDRVTELRDLARESLVEDTDWAEWLLMMNRERFTSILMEALGVMLNPEIAAEGEAAIAQDSSRARDWAMDG
jgi:hypothetical protein